MVCPGRQPLIRMKILLLLVLGIAPTLLPAAAPDDALPVAYPASRYQKFGLHSPFSPPTVATPPPAPVQGPKAPGWADSLSVAGATQVGGYYLVTIVDRGSNEHFTVSTDPTIKNARDVTLTSVRWFDSLDQTQVTLQRAGEFAVVKFDPSASKSSPGLPGIQPVTSGLPRTNNPLNRPAFPPPPGNGSPSGSASSVVRRTPPIRASPTPPVVPKTNAIAPGPGVKLPGADDDDDDD